MRFSSDCSIFASVGERFRLTVNGASSEIEASADTPLLYALRNDLALKGTRFGCGNGQCGACFVLIDGYPAPACDTPLWSVVGKSITTVEGLGTDGRLHPLQNAFLAEQAAQCGYCTSGILIRAAALLAENPRPTESEVRAALDRNLCRCGSHNRMVRAVLRAAQE
jgi:nicotinate dehydrogenase subunit A